MTSERMQLCVPGTSPVEDMCECDWARDLSPVEDLSPSLPMAKLPVLGATAAKAWRVCSTPTPNAQRARWAVTTNSGKETDELNTRAHSRLK